MRIVDVRAGETGQRPGWSARLSCSLRATCWMAAVLVGVIWIGTPVAAAEEPEPEAESPLERFVRQARKILHLMEENETALLGLSAGEDASVASPDVPVPPPEGARAPQAAPQGSGGAGRTGARGEEIRKQLEALLGKRGSSRTIPSEIERLIQLIPK